MNYIPLHVHSHFSLLDGLSQCKQIASRINELELEGCALTDHGSISGAIQFLTKMEKAKKKPIIGCEFYVCSQDATIKDNQNKKLSHMVVLAKNYEGWKDLVKLVSLSNTPDLAYYKPRLDLDRIAEIGQKGNLIAFSGHLGSNIANEILVDNELDPLYNKKAIRLAEKLKEAFSGNFWLEVQLMDQILNPQQKIVADIVRSVSKQTGIPLVATPDAHYARKEDAPDQRVLLCSNLKTTMKQASNPNFGMSTFFKSDNYHIPSHEEMQQWHTEEELDNTRVIADQIGSYEGILKNPALPNFPCPKGSNPDEYLRQLCRDGWTKKIKDTIPKDRHQEYADRVKYELEVLQGAGLSSYFLVVGDIVDFVKQKGWLAGPGRGCFLPDTRVTMASGFFKKISKIEIGDCVIDAYGVVREVYDTLVYDIDEDILELEFDDGKIVRCTEDHEFLTKNRGWTQAQYLDDSDVMIVLEDSCNIPGEFVMFRVGLQSKRTFRHKGKVHDLSVTNSHSYNAEGIAVHNSAAGCMVSYLLSITAIDPIKYDLIFERFYNAGRNTADRVSLPDIDVDVPKYSRDHVIKYIKDKYGHDKVGQMVTFQKMKGAGALKAVMRAHGGIPFEEMNKVTKGIIEEHKISDELQQMEEDRGESSLITWCLENTPDKLKDWCVLEGDKLTGQFAAHFAQAIRLEGTNANRSKHAAGVVVSPDPLDEVCPMVLDGETKNLIAGLEMTDLESIGGCKLDILGLTLLDKMMAVSQLLKTNELKEIE